MARFAAITALAFVLSRALGLVRDVVIAQRFGTRSEPTRTRSRSPC
ncbi:MAG: hypothetical protein WKH64_01495 [Chloroflexia bacterium]